MIVNLKIFEKILDWKPALVETLRCDQERIAILESRCRSILESFSSAKIREPNVSNEKISDILFEFTNLF